MGDGIYSNDRDGCRFGNWDYFYDMITLDDREMLQCDTIRVRWQIRKHPRYFTKNKLKEYCKPMLIEEERCLKIVIDK